MTTLFAHTAEAWTRRTGAPSPAGVVAVVVDGDDGRQAWWLAGNPLASGWTWPSLPPSPACLVAAGSLVDDAMTPHPPNWMGPGRRRLDLWCEDTRRIAPGLTEVWLIPHARQILSDVPSTLAFLHDQTDSTFGIALAPARLFEPAMLDHAEDHLTRIVEGLGPRARVVIVEDAAVDGEDCTAVPAGDGRLPMEHLTELLATLVPADVPRIVRAAGQVVAGGSFA